MKIFINGMLGQVDKQDLSYRLDTMDDTTICNDNSNAQYDDISGKEFILNLISIYRDMPMKRMWRIKLKDCYYYFLVIIRFYNKRCVAIKKK